MFVMWLQVMLVGQDQRSLGALVVINPMVRFKGPHQSKGEY